MGAALGEWSPLALCMSRWDRVTPENPMGVYLCCGLHGLQPAIVSRLRLPLARIHA